MLISQLKGDKPNGYVDQSYFGVSMSIVSNLLVFSYPFQFAQSPTFLTWILLSAFRDIR